MCYSPDIEQPDEDEQATIDGIIQGMTDGRLYLSGHDLPELYAVTLPKGGATLDYAGTYAMAAEGQAIDWDESQQGHFWGITRKGGEMIEMRLLKTGRP